MPSLSGKDRNRDLPYAWYWKGDPLSRHRLEREPIMPLDIGPRRGTAACDYAPRPWLGRLSLASIIPTRRQRVSARPLGQMGPGFFSGENLLETRRSGRGLRSAHPFEPWEPPPFAGFEPPRGPGPAHPWCGTSSYPPRPPFDRGSRFPHGSYGSPRSPYTWPPDEQDGCEGCEDAVEYECDCSSDGDESCRSDEMGSMGGGSYRRCRPNRNHSTPQMIHPSREVPLNGQAYARDLSPCSPSAGRRFMAPYGERGESRVPRRAHYGDDIGLRRF